jgi:hypothetical protein
LYLFAYSLEIPDNHPVLKVVKATICQNKEHFNSFLADVDKKKGEGVILRKGTATYFENDASFYKDLRNSTTVMMTGIDNGDIICST